MTRLSEHSSLPAMPAEASNPPASLRLRRFAGGAVTLRFALAPEHGEAFAGRLTHSTGVAPAKTRHQMILLDTQDDAIAKLGFAYGIRRRGEGADGVWKRSVAPLSLASSKNAAHAVKHILRQATGISAVAQIVTHRRLWKLHFGDGEAEVVLDCTTARMNDKDFAIASAKLMIKAPIRDFFHWVKELCGNDPLRLTADDDLARLYRLAGGVLPSHTPAFAPKLDATMDTATGFRAVATACFEHFLRNEEAIRVSSDYEAVHQARVALRRLSASRHFFSAIAKSPDGRALWRELKIVGAHLRAARDLDVLIADVIMPVLAARQPAGLAALLREIETRRAAAHAALVACLAAPATATLFLRFALWLQHGDWTKPQDVKTERQSARPLVKWAQKKWAKLDQRFVQRCDELSNMNAAERHRTRILAKNIRYDAEFMESLIRAKTDKRRLRRFLAAVKELQTVLGDWNDVIAAQQFFATFTAGAKAASDTPKTQRLIKNSSLVAAASSLANTIAQISETDFRERVAAASKALHAAKPFWSKLA